MTAEDMKNVTTNLNSTNAGQPDEQPHPRHGKMISIWFFVGCLLTVYGLLILIAGLSNEGGSGRQIAMANLHAQIWWGVGLLVIGLGYVARFRPRK